MQNRLKIGAILAVIIMLVVISVSPAYTQATSCPTGHTDIAKYEWEDGEFVAEYGGGIVTVGNITLDKDNEPVSGHFTSTIGISYVVVKAGTEDQATQFDPKVTTGTFATPNTHAISHVLFCAPEGPTAINLLQVEAGDDNNIAILAVILTLFTFLFFVSIIAIKHWRRRR